MNFQHLGRLTVKEIHESVSEVWPAGYEDILQCIAANFDCIPRPTLRWYRVALAAKLKGRDWRYALASEWVRDNSEYAVVTILYKRFPVGRPMEKEWRRRGLKIDSLRRLLPQYLEARKLLAAS